MPLEAGADSKELIASGEARGPYSGRKPWEFRIFLRSIGERRTRLHIRIYEQFITSNVLLSRTGGLKIGLTA